MNLWILDHPGDSKKKRPLSTKEKEGTAIGGQTLVMCHGFDVMIPARDIWSIEEADMEGRWKKGES